MSHPLHRKIVTPAALAEIVRGLRQAGRTIVQCHGCFDIVHPGHVRYLAFARRLGDVLIVSLTGDALIDKAPNRPLIPQELRAENLAALELVDWVVVDAHPSAVEILELVRPDVYVKGREYAASNDPRFAEERRVVERHGGRVVFSSGDVVFSSTRLVEALDADPQLDYQRLCAYVGRHGIDGASAAATLAAFRGMRVVVVGDVLIDRYLFCDAGEVAADAPVLSLHQIGSQEFWGGAAAVALQLRALGAAPFVLSRIGCDAASEELARRFETLQLPGRLARDRADTPLRTTCLVDEAKHSVVHHAATCPMDSAAEAAAAAALREQLTDARLLILCDHGLGMITPGLLAEALRGGGPGLLRAGHAPGRRAALAALCRLDLLTASERRLRESARDMSAGLSAIAWGLLDATQGRSLIVTMHRRGLVCFRRQSDDPASSAWRGRLRSEYVPALANHFVDALGVDEAVLSVAALALAAGRGVEFAGYLAAAAAALAASRVGAGEVPAEVLSNWLSLRPELDPRGRPAIDERARGTTPAARVETLAAGALARSPLAAGEAPGPAGVPRPVHQMACD